MTPRSVPSRKNKKKTRNSVPQKQPSSQIDRWRETLVGRVRESERREGERGKQQERRKTVRGERGKEQERKREGESQ